MFGKRLDRDRLRVRMMAVGQTQLAAVALALSLHGNLGHAQVVRSGIQNLRTGRAIATTNDAGIPTTADLALAHVRYLQGEMLKTISIMRNDYPFDSVRTVIAGHARAALASVDERGRARHHLSATAELFALAEEDDSARASFAARLAMPALSLQEKAYTYSVAIGAFADYQRPGRVHIAEEYLRGLYTLGVAAAAYQLESEWTVVQAYYDMHQYEAASRHAMAAVDLLPTVPYRYRRSMYDQNIDRYGIIVDALSHTANGKRRIDELNAKLRAALPAPADSIAMDAAFAQAAALNTDEISLMIKAHALVGERGHPLVSNYWINTPDTTAHAMAVNDGKVRIIQFGSTGCGSCLMMASALQRIYEGFGRRIEPVWALHSYGFWGNRTIAPREEAAKIKAWALEERQIRFPIAFNLVTQTYTDYGEFAPTPDSNYTNYPFISKPTLYMLDGTGTIRRVFVGYNREMESHIIAAIRTLLGTLGTVTATSDMSPSSSPSHP